MSQYAKKSINYTNLKEEVEQARFNLAKLIKKRKVERENRNLLVDIKNKTFQMTEVMMDGNVSKSQDFSKNTNNTNKFKNKLKLPQFNDRKIVVEVNI